MVFPNKSAIGLIFACIYLIPALFLLGFEAYCANAFIDVGPCVGNDILMYLVSLPVSTVLFGLLSIPTDKYIVFNFIVASVVYSLLLYFVGAVIQGIFVWIQDKIISNSKAVK